MWLINMSLFINNNNNNGLIYMEKKIFTTEPIDNWDHEKP